MSSIAIITARGGSKRIPRKNIKDFLGKPIIAYSIEAALGSGVFDEVMVSTDDEEIAEIARKYGAKVPFFRSEATSNDFATTADVILEVLDYYNKNLEKTFDHFICIYPTAPFVTADKLKDAYGQFKREDADSLVPVVRFSFPPQRGFKCENGIIQYLHPEFERTRSQDLEPIYHDCGQFYICKADAFTEKKSLILNKTVPFFISETEVQDIDTETDWIIAEQKYKVMKGK
ncbi:MAG: pseudaminic acid cytidylyltransferase [Lachnospiraceae bacterium]|nr:pseudaminic acid cytidylyltransferase [Lachnospiraceae bacterium]